MYNVEKKMKKKKLLKLTKVVRGLFLSFIIIIIIRKSNIKK